MLLSNVMMGSRRGACPVGGYQLVLVAALAVLAGCSDGDGMPSLLGGGGGLVEGQAVQGAPQTPSEETPASLRAAYIAKVQGNAGPEYHFEEASGRAVARTPSQGFTAELADGALHVDPESESADWSLELRWTGIGRGDDIRPVERPVGGVEVKGNRVTYRRSDGSEEWYLNGPLGIEQGFALPRRPSGASGELILTLATGNQFEPAQSAGDAAVRLSSKNEPVALRYTDLMVHDAEGTLLRAWFAVSGGSIEIHVEDRSARYPLRIDPLIWGEIARLTASDPEEQDQFGNSIAISGNIAIVGAFAEDSNGSMSGAAYVFQRDNGGTNNWGEVKKLTASDAEATDMFGTAVAISGDIVIVGAPYEDAAGNSAGAAYVFHRDNGGTDNWGEVKKLTASDAQADGDFGWSVSISGNTAIVGAYGVDDLPGAGVNAGAAYVFYRNNGGIDNWGEVRKLTASDADAEDSFGYSIALDGDTAIVGTEWEDGGGSDTGAAYVFQRDDGGTNNWGEIKKLTASDAQSDDRFACSVAISADTAVVGAYREFSGGANAGAAYVFYRDNGGAGNWGEVRKLTASDVQAGAQFGHAAAVSVDTAIVGAGWEDFGWSNVGAAYVFDRNQGGGDNWGQIKKLTASDAWAGDLFGCSVGVSGDTGIVGASGKDSGASMAGGAYIVGLRKSDGDPCATDDECLSQHCIDGVCCDTDCGGGDTLDCQACSTAAGAASDGACAPSTGNSCDDGLYCNGTDTCQAGACQHSGDPCPGVDGDADCSESCHEASDTCLGDDPDLSACNDGLYCNGSETCTAGVCGGSTGDPCDGADGDGSCTESCDEANDNCLGADPDGSVCDDGSFCNGTETCTSGVCGNSTGDPCAANVGDADTDCSESCSEATDDCTGNDPDGSTCDDGAYCTGVETCHSGACTSAGDPCAANVGDADTDCSESCSEATDDCTGNDPDSSICSDGDYCNGTETCTNGVCGSSTGNPCASLIGDGDNDCQEACDETADSCTAEEPDSTACDDGLYCTATDACQAGVCVGTGDPCQDEIGDGDNDCQEACDEEGQDCTAEEVDGTSCDDSVHCNGTDSCLSGQCDAHSGDPCNEHVADGDTDCAEACEEDSVSCTAAEPNGTSCAGGGVCREGACLAGGGTSCTDDAECNSGYCTDGVCCTSDDCSPYRCDAESGDCPEGCTSTADCQPGYACSSDGKCVDALAQDAGADDGGCSCRVPGRAPAGAPTRLLALLGLGLMAARRRRCSGQVNAA